MTHTTSRLLLLALCCTPACNTPTLTPSTGDAGAPSEDARVRGDADRDRRDGSSPDAWLEADAGALADSGPVDGATSPGACTPTMDVPANGTVTAARTPCPRGSRRVGTSCEHLVVSCPGLEDDAVELVISEPTGAPRGTLVLESGQVGRALYAGVDGDENAVARELVADLAALGFRVIERAWELPGGWMQGEGGMRVTSCRFATLVSYIRENLMVGEALCASGNSGGSMELSAALAFRGAAASLDFAMPTSGPAGRLDFACGADGTFPEWTAQCHEVRDRYGASDRVSCVFDGESAGVDQNFGPGTATCSAASDATFPTLRADSILGAPGGELCYPGTRIAYLFGTADGTAPAVTGPVVAEAVRAAGTEVVAIEFVEGAPHELHHDPIGAPHILAMFDEHCRAR